MNRAFRSVRRLCALALLLALCAPMVACRSSTGRVADTFSATFPAAAVAADHPLASQAGMEMLELGGNAVDAAVATSFALAVVRPFSCGLGGGGFMVIHLENDPHHGTLHTAINYRERAPAAVGPDFYETLPEHASLHGGAAVGVPGTVAGLLHALDKYGTLDRATVLAPAIRFADAGFVVDQAYVGAARSVGARFEADAGYADRFAVLWERLLKRGAVRAGDRITSPELARTLRLIAERGAAAFYQGPVADAIVETVQASGGDMVAQDLRDFVVSEVEPLVRQIDGRVFVTMPPPSSGGVALLQALLLLDQTGNGFTSSPSWFYVDRADRLGFLEVLKHVFADRARLLGDPEYVDVPVDDMLGADAITALARTIRTGPHAIETYGSSAPPPDDAGTSHISVVDRHGSAVACTETINASFGSLLVVEPYGIVLNNEMDDFTTRSGRPNLYGLVQSDRNLPAPGKRPVSSMSPTIVLDADGVLAVAGASGGPRIITATLQVLLGALAVDGDARESISRPRVHHQWIPDVLRMERGAWAGDEAALQRNGYPIEVAGPLGVVQIIQRDPKGRGWRAASDPRKGGRPAGL